MHFLPVIDVVLAGLGLGALFPHWGSASPGNIMTSDDVVLFDAPAFIDPANSGTTLAQFDAFVFARQVHVQPAVFVIRELLSAFGVSVDQSMPNLVNRSKLFAAMGLGDKTIQLNVQGCAAQASLSKTADFPESGLFNRNASLGACDFQPNGVYSATVVLSASDNRTISSNIFFYPDSGFGVISDIDDTVKVTHVLDTSEMLKTTFLDDPVPVDGMPELYASLARSLSPHFFYVSGSMLQIYPFIHDFIDTTYSSSKGPLFLRNLTDIHDIVNFMESDGIFEYKSAIIDQIKGMYPNKKFLVVGDSTQKDPETYGEAYRKYGDSIMCAWIRKVDGANNTAARFAAAFDGVPSSRWRVFNDSEIPGLADINVANGEC
ncbi:hypothetical protein F5887DRAFT_1068303 [Amanita rubescens]|nr:hypothetical protein F5887DRAFT_1068303 [Amanita rubescens]